MRLQTSDARNGGGVERNQSEISQEAISNTQEHSQHLHAQIEHAEELNRLIRESSGYPKDMQVAMGMKQQNIRRQKRIGEVR